MPHRALQPAVPRRRAALPWVVAAGVLLASCGGAPQAPGEQRYIQDDAYRIADPGIIGASATGTGCGMNRNEALTMARRIAQFNLRSLTGSARYNVRYRLVKVTPNAQGECVEVNATAIEPRPFER